MYKEPLTESIQYDLIILITDFGNEGASSRNLVNDLKEIIEKIQLRTLFSNTFRPRLRLRTTL